MVRLSSGNGHTLKIFSFLLHILTHICMRCRKKLVDWPGKLNVQI